MNKIQKILLKKIGIKNIAQYLIEISRPAETSADDKTWSEAFFRVPLLKDWLRKRELSILKGLPFSKDSSDFLRGQLFENLLYQHYDVSRPDLAQTGESTKVKVVEEKLIDKTAFVKKWNNENAHEKTTPSEQNDVSQKGEKIS